MIQLTSGFPFSLIKYGLPFDYPKVEENLNTDVVIVGGGISGALMAYYLIKAGISCILIDKRTIGLGSTCASTSLLQYEIDVPLYVLKKKIGNDNAKRAYLLCKQAIESLSAIALDIDFRDFEFKNSLYFAAQQKHKKGLEEEYDARKESGFLVEWLDEQSIREQFGFTAPAAILSHHGAQTNAYTLTHSILQYSIKKGLKVFDRTAANTINHEKNGIKIKTDKNFELNARKLVYATGYEAVQYIDKHIVNLQTTYATISEELENESSFRNDTMMWNTNDPYLYLRTDKKRILVGGRDKKNFNPQKEDTDIKKREKQLINDFHTLFLHIEFNSEMSWAGVFGSTKDGLPYIGIYPKFPHGYFALGFGGNGITFSQIAAVIITDLFLGKRNEDAELFSFNRI